jgi:hypothetical protein
VEVVFDTSRFRGLRTKAFYLETENGKTVVTRFTVRADSQDAPQP